MSDIKVRVGQQNSIKVISSVSGAAGGRAVFAQNVIGGIASVTSLNVSGISTFGGSIYAEDLFLEKIRYLSYFPNSVAYFNQVGILTHTQNPANAINYTNYLLTTNNFGVPAWSSVIDGGTY